MSNLKSVQILTATTRPSRHERAMGTAIATLEPQRTVKFVPGETGALSDETLDYCPLTVSVPGLPDFSFSDCQDVAAQRRFVEQQWSIHTCEQGNAWLPVIWTAKGPLYAEVIQIQGKQHQQPLHLRDPERQPLYRFAFQLLDSYQAPPAVYMMAIHWAEGQFAFDHLVPFPNEAAIASVGVQSPDLFICHWLCLTNKPILDIQIAQRD